MVLKGFLHGAKKGDWGTWLKVLNKLPGTWNWGKRKQLFALLSTAGCEEMASKRSKEVVTQKKFGLSL